MVGAGGLDRNGAEHLVLCVYDPPFALNFAGFGGKRFHRGVKEARKLREMRGGVNPVRRQVSVQL